MEGESMVLCHQACHRSEWTPTRHLQREIGIICKLTWPVVKQASVADAGKQCLRETWKWMEYSYFSYWRDGLYSF